ncbi:hypothetical protein TSO221_14510 [Azospirillum sp. TSO22-1]|nr:hypothetical protein TSO221_14510 [Azospirillum sp. TSO22-1]
MAVAVAAVAALVSMPAGAESILDKLTLDSVHTGSIRIGRATVPLPEGEWIVTALNEAKNTSNSVLATVTLASFAGEKLSGYITIDLNADMSASGWTPHQFCHRTDVYFIHKDADYGNDQACWGVNHYVFDKTSTYKPTQGKNIQATLAGRGQTMPSTMIYALYRLSDRSNYLTYAVHVNPALSGFADETGKWADSSWHKDLIGASPDKVAYLEAFKAKAAPLYAAMKDGGLYTGRADPAAAAKPAPGGASQTTAAPSVEQRLTTLKDLHDRQVITPAEYEAKRKEILGGL